MLVRAILTRIGGEMYAAPHVKRSPLYPTMIKRAHCVDEYNSYIISRIRGRKYQNDKRAFWKLRIEQCKKY